MKKKQPIILLILLVILMSVVCFACEDENESDQNTDIAIQNIESNPKEENVQGLDFYLQDDGTYAVGVGKAVLLSKIIIPETYLGKAVTAISSKDIACGFENCVYLQEIEIPKSVLFIGKKAFSGCSRLTTAKIPDSVTAIGDEAFSNCSKLTSAVIPNSVTSIGYKAFFGCGGLTSVVISDNVTSIGEYTFYNCYALSSAIIPDSVTDIGRHAFRGCSGLTSVVIGEKVATIGSYAFSSCSGLQKIYYHGTADARNGMEIESNNEGLQNATQYNFSANKPTEAGNYWHYAVDGKTVSEW